MSDHSSTSVPLELSLQLRWGDMDINAHVNNVQFARLFEEARVRAFSAWFPGFSDLRRRVSALVASQTIEFRAPLLYSLEPVTLRVAIARIGRTSYTMALTLLAPDGTVSAVAETTMVMIDAASARPTPIPDDFRAVLEANLDAAAGLRQRTG
ncbi:thioesterase family protein [Gordonia sinesedis]